MPLFYNSKIPPPENWQDFESLCRDLWREIWGDTNTQRNGRGGQAQVGVDIFGRSNKGDWCGVQCKCKNITKSDVYEEVKEAKNFEPKLSEFIIATTGSKDVNLEKLARKITEEHSKEGLFSVFIWGWDDIKNRLAEFPDVLEKHYPEISNNLKKLEEKQDVAIEKQDQMLEILSRIENIIYLEGEDHKIKDSLEENKIIDSNFMTIIKNSRVLFIGDEVSKKSTDESFGAFIIDIIELVTNHEITRPEFYELTENLYPESAFKILYDELGNDILICFEYLNKYEPNEIHYYIANEIKNGKWVFTTNRDNLIEKACKNKINLEGKIIYSDTCFTQFNEKIQTSKTNQDIPVGRLFKLNGSVDEKEGIEKFETILTSLNQTWNNLATDKTKVLKYFLTNFDFFFVGFDCSDNFSLFPIFKNTNTEKSIIWFNYENRPIEKTSSREFLESEIETEICKRLRERNTKKICINNILLKREKFTKIIGNWNEILNLNQFSGVSVGKIEYPLEIKNKLSEKVDDYKRNIIFGRLWEECLSTDKAIMCFKEAKYNSEGINKAKARHSLARVYDEQRGKSKADIVITEYQESFKLYMACGIFDKAIECKLGLANYKRRSLDQFKDALTDCNEIEKMIKCNEFREKIKSEKKKKECKLIYAQYFICLGLIYSRLGNEYIDKCDDLLKASLKYRKEVGDIKGEAESENAIGLIIRNKQNKTIEDLENAVKHLNKSLEINESIGNYIGCARNYRNLGLCYTDLIGFTENEKTIIEQNFQKAKKSYEAGINYWYTIKGSPPLEEILECKFRLGELEINYGNVNKGIELLRKIEGKWDVKAWNNRARTLHLLCKAYKNSEFTHLTDIEKAKSTVDDIISIYNTVLRDQDKIKQMKNNVKTYENALQIISDAKKTINNIKINSKELSEFDDKLIILDDILKRLEYVMCDDYLSFKGTC